MKSFGHFVAFSVLLVLAQGMNLREQNDVRANNKNNTIATYRSFVYDGRNYEISSFPLEWNEAKRACWDLGMELVSIETMAENNAILNEIRHDKDKFWTSGTDLGNEGHWVWDSTGEPIGYSYWEDGEPNNFFGNEHCCKTMGEKKHQLWNDNGCWDSERYICEQPAQRR